MQEKSLQCCGRKLVQGADALKVRRAVRGDYNLVLMQGADAWWGEAPCSCGERACRQPDPAKGEDGDGSIEA